MRRGSSPSRPPGGRAGSRCTRGRRTCGENKPALPSARSASRQHSPAVAGSGHPRPISRFEARLVGQTGRPCFLQYMAAHEAAARRCPASRHCSAESRCATHAAGRLSRPPTSPHMYSPTRSVAHAASESVRCRMPTPTTQLSPDRSGSAHVSVVNHGWHVHVPFWSQPTIWPPPLWPAVLLRQRPRGSAPDTSQPCVALQRWPDSATSLDCSTWRGRGIWAPKARGRSA